MTTPEQIGQQVGCLTAVVMLCVCLPLLGHPWLAIGLASILGAVGTCGAVALSLRLQPCQPPPTEIENEPVRKPAVFVVPPVRITSRSRTWPSPTGGDDFRPVNHIKPGDEHAPH